MVKRREVKSVTPSIEERIEQFAAGADSDPVKQVIINKNDKRDYKGLRLPFNQYEFELLELGTRLTGQTKSSFIRNAIIKAVNDLLAKGEKHD